MVSATTDEIVFSLVGGDISLDFTNTLSGRLDDHDLEGEKLTGYRVLLSWARQAGIVSTGQSAQLLKRAERHPLEAAAALERAVRLREAIYQIFLAVVTDKTPPGKDLDILNAELSEAMSRLRLTHGGEGFSWEWEAGEQALSRVLWPIARSAAELLISGNLGRVRECAGHDCGWLFLDMSRNHSRQWCDMKDCGNRAKAKRHYRRTKGRDA